LVGRSEQGLFCPSNASALTRGAGACSATLTGDLRSTGTSKCDTKTCGCALRDHPASRLSSLPRGDHVLQDASGRGLRRPTAERWRRVVFQHQLNFLRDSRSEQLCSHGQAEIDACRHTATGNAVPINDDPLVDGLGPEQFYFMLRREPRSWVADRNTRCVVTGIATVARSIRNTFETFVTLTR
jgi:hypothetical protein